MTTPSPCYNRPRHRISRSRRLLLLLLVPVLGFPILLAPPIAERWQAVRALDHDRALLEFGDTLGATLHESQVERALFVCQLDNGSSCHELLTGQTVGTNSAVHALAAQVHALSDTEPGFDAYAARWQQAADNLGKLRSRAPAAVRPSHLLAAYSGSHSALLDLTLATARAAIDDTTARTLSNYADLLAIEERCADAATRLARIGLHNSSLALVAEARLDIVQLRSELHSIEHRYRLNASIDGLARYDALRARPDVQLLIGLIDEVAAGDDEALAAAPTQWFAASMRAVEAFGNAEAAGLHARLEAITAARAHAVWSAAAFSGLATAFVLANLACLVLGYRLLRRWARRLKSERDHAEQLAWIAEYTTNMAIVADAASHIRWVNHGFTKMTGYRLEDVKTLEPEQLFAGEEANQTIPAAIRAGQDVECDVRLRARDGRRYWLHLEIRVLRDHAGAVKAYIAIGTDISWRKLAELRLNESEGRLRRAMSGSSDGYWEVDLTTGESFASSRFMTLLGYAAPDEAGLSSFKAADIWHRIHPDDVNQARTVHRAHIDNGARYDLTVRLRRRSGEYRWFRIRAAAERDDSGTPQRLAGVLSDVTELKAAQGELEWHALHDSLTGLANRQQFLDRLSRIQRGSRRTDQGVCAILSMDFDRFKLVNDVYGHAAGDELLCSIARRLKDAVRAGDLVARFGGDEFLVLLVNTQSASSVQQVAQRLCSKLAAPHQLTCGADVTSTASIGVIVLEAGDTRPAELLLREADAAMYQAKAEAKGTYRFFDRELRVRMTRKALLEADLRKADYDAHFRLVYQPIVNLHTGAITGFEALLRWRRNGNEPISPVDFIPIAEDTGMIVPIGRWVVKRACLDLLEWRRSTSAATAIGISLNVSRREIVEPDYCDAVASIVCSNGLQPGDINFELTETTLIGARSNLLPIANRLRSAGFRLSMDDFGTGQSSLNSLMNLPIDTLKIDKEFVRSMTANRNSIAVVNAIVTLARQLDMQVVAEGIESAPEVATLQAMDCEFGQGFHFAAPVATAEAVAMLRDGLPGSTIADTTLHLTGQDSRRGTATDDRGAL